MSELVGLRGGLTVPVAPLELAIHMESRGLTLSIEGDRLRVTGLNGTKPDLSLADVEAIRRWKPHLMALVAYRAPNPEWLES